MAAPTTPRPARPRACWRCSRRRRPARCLFSSGMAAATAVFQALNPGDHVVAPKVMYWALRNWLATEATALGPWCRFRRDRQPRHAAPGGACRAHEARLDRDALEPALDASPTSRRRPRSRTRRAPAWRSIPTCRLAVPHPAPGARRRHRDACRDESAERPFGRGRGRPCGRARDGRVLGADRHDPQERRARSSGRSRPISLMRGLRTLHLRAAAQARSAMALAERLSAHPKVARVLYPGLPQHPGHDVAARQMEGGFGYMLSIQVSGGEAAAIARGGAGRAVEAGDLARRGRKPDRAPGLDRRAGHPLSARPAAAVDRDRGCGGPLSPISTQALRAD